jgi:hypothetical protein
MLLGLLMEKTNQTFYRISFLQNIGTYFSESSKNQTPFTIKEAGGPAFRSAKVRKRKTWSRLLMEKPQYK